MRTIASTVGTREEAELATRRLQAIGIAPDRVQLKEVTDPQVGVFISVKVSPDQVNAATDILKGGSAAIRSEPEPALRDTAATEAPPRAPVSDPAPGPAPPVPTASSYPARASQVGDRGTPQASRSVATSGKPLGRIIFMALALAAFGFALGAILGTFT